MLKENGSVFLVYIYMFCIGNCPDSWYVIIGIVCYYYLLYCIAIDSSYLDIAAI